MSKKGQATESALKGVATVAAGVLVGGLTAAAGAAAASVVAYAGFEKTISAIGAVSGASAEDLARLSETALRLGKETSFSAKEAAAGMEELAKAGLTTEQIIGGGAKAALDLAAAGGVKVAEAAGLAATALTVFNKDASELSGVADQIAGFANVTAGGVNDFKFALQASGAVASMVGLSFEDTAAAITALGKAGILGSDAGTSLKTMLTNLTPKTNEARKAFNELGLTSINQAKVLEELRLRGIEPVSDSLTEQMNQLARVVIGTDDWAKVTKAQSKQWSEFTEQFQQNAFFDETSGQLKDLASIAGTLQGALSGLSTEEQLQALHKLFGSDAIRAGSILFKEGAEGIATLREELTKVTAADVGEARLDNLAGSVEKLTGSAETLAIQAGQKLAPGLRRAADEATEFLNTLIDDQGLQDFIGAVGEGLAGAIDAAVSAFKAIRGVIGSEGDDRAGFIAQLGFTAEEADKLAKVLDLLRGSTEESEGPVAALSAVWNASLIPLRLVKDAIVLAADWIVKLRDTYNAALPHVQKFATDAEAAIRGFAEQVGQFIGNTIQAGRDLITAVQTWAQPHLDFAAGAINAVKLIVRYYTDDFLAWLRAFVAPLTEAVAPWIEALSAWVGFAWTAVSGLLTAFLSDLTAWMGGTTTEVETGAGHWLTAATSWAGQLWSKVSGPLGEFVNSILSALGGSVVGQLSAAGAELAGGLISGFVNGITAGAAQAVNRVRSWAESVIEAAKQRYEEKSPSKVFERIGYGTMQGFAIGIEGGAPLVLKSLDAALARFEARVTEGGTALGGAFTAAFVAAANTGLTNLDNLLPGGTGAAGGPPGNGLNQFNALLAWLRSATMEQVSLFAQSLGAPLSIGDFFGPPGSRPPGWDELLQQLAGAASTGAWRLFGQAVNQLGSEAGVAGLLTNPVSLAGTAAGGSGGLVSAAGAGGGAAGFAGNAGVNLGEIRSAAGGGSRSAPQPINVQVFIGDREVDAVVRASNAREIRRTYGTR